MGEIPFRPPAPAPAQGAHKDGLKLVVSRMGKIQVFQAKPLEDAIKGPVAIVARGGLGPFAKAPCPFFDGAGPYMDD